MKILLTGSTGFIGKHIADQCLRQGHELLCIRHGQLAAAAGTIKEFSPEVLVHSAWGGVSAADRNDAAIQQANVEMSEAIIKAYPYKQIICLGSQDEYGVLSGIADESHPLNPVTEYAKAKVRVCLMLKEYACEKGIEWQWLRLFSLYGPGQSEKWMIPSIIARCLSGEKSMDVTAGEQKYACLWVEDLADGIVRMFGSQGKSGIYNMSASTPVALKDLFLKIRELTGSKLEFRFGALPYRANQSMVICGDCSRYSSAFGPLEKTGLNQGLEAIVKTYSKRTA